MKRKAISSILEVVVLASFGTLSLFFIAEILLGQDVFFAHPLVALSIASIFIPAWFWRQDRLVANDFRRTGIRPRIGVLRARRRADAGAGP